MKTPDVEYIPKQFPKICSCGLPWTMRQWTALHYDGIQPGYDEFGRRFYPYDLELRRCLCGSTMAIPIVGRSASCPSSTLTGPCASAAPSAEAPLPSQRSAAARR